MNLSSYFHGVCIINIKGYSLNRLINICINNNLNYKVKQKKLDFLFYIPYKEKNRFLLYVNKLNLSYEIIKEKGFPMLYCRFKVRYWVLLFLLLLIGVLHKFSLYIWKIDVIGTSNYTSEQISNYVSAKLIPFGTEKKNINCNELEEALRIKYNNLGWINCFIEGTKLTIEVLETVPIDKNIENKTACNIVAIKDATISEAIATSGYLIVEKGMEIKKGDILVTGVMPIYNDYGEEQGTKYCAANGSIYGIVAYDYKDSIQLMQNINIPIISHSKYSVFFGGVAVDLSFDQNDNTITEYKQFKIGQTYLLPVSICKKKNVKYKEKTIEITQDEAKQIANNHLQKYIYDLRKKGVEIIQNNVKIQVVNGHCIANGQIICKEQIGIAVPIDCDSQGEE